MRSLLNLGNATRPVLGKRFALVNEGAARERTYRYAVDFNQNLFLVAAPHISMRGLVASTEEL